MLYVELIGPYRKLIIQQQPGAAIIKNNVSITCMPIINPAMDWFEIVEVPTYYLDEGTGGNDECIDKLYARVIQLFNNTCLRRYPHPYKVLFDNGSEF